MSYTGARFSAPLARCRRFTSWILQYVPHVNPLRVLDIGCGTGLQIFDLAQYLPHARFTGIDISEINISLADKARLQLPYGDRIEFLGKNYMELQVAPFDLIISYSTLHLIPVSQKTLFGKISNDLAAGGLLVNAMPYDCLFNRWLSLIRRLCKALRSTSMDTIIFKLAKRLHGDEMDQDQLLERIVYMYQLPECYGGAVLHQLLRTHCGLEVAGEHNEIHASIGQLKHRITVFRKVRSPS